MTTRARSRPAAGREERIAELERRLQTAADAAKTQEALYQIADLASAAEALEAFYAGVHGILGELMYAENIYIALVDEERREINFAYYADTVDTDTPDPRAWEPYDKGYTKGVTGWIVRHGRPLFTDRAALAAMTEAGEV